MHSVHNVQEWNQFVGETVSAAHNDCIALSGSSRQQAIFSKHLMVDPRLKGAVQSQSGHGDAQRMTVFLIIS